MTSDRDEFEKAYAAMNDGFCPSAYDGEYDWADAQRCWEIWQAARTQAGNGAGAVPEWENEAKRAFWSGLEIGAGMGSVAIAPRWDEYIAKQKGEIPHLTAAPTAPAVPLGYVDNSYKPGDLNACVIDLFGNKTPTHCYPVYLHPHNGEQGGGWLRISQLEQEHADENGQVWTVDDIGNVELVNAHNLLQGWHSHIIYFQPTGLKRPAPPTEREDSHE